MVGNRLVRKYQLFILFIYLIWAIIFCVLILNKSWDLDKKTESVYWRGQNRSISLFKLKVGGKEIKLTGEDYSFTGLKLKVRKEIRL